MRLWPFSAPADRITTYGRTPDGVQQVPFTSLPTRVQDSRQLQPSLPAPDIRRALEQLRVSSSGDAPTVASTHVGPIAASNPTGSSTDASTHVGSSTAVSTDGGSPTAASPHIVGPTTTPAVARADLPIARDASANPAAVLMGYDAQDPVSLDFIAQMAAVGQVEDFRVLAAARPDELPSAQRKLAHEARANTDWVSNAGGHDAWVEDHGEFTESGSVVLPALVPASGDDIEDWIIRGRAERYDALMKAGQPRPRQDFSMLGLVNRRQAQQEIFSTAVAVGAPDARLAVSYVEGGNMLPGRRADGSPLLLVGKDSLAVTRHLLPKGADDAAAAAQVARDYGYQPEQVVPVEQPGDFHIDMAMALVGPGQVLLNDARQVLQLQTGWLSEHYAHSWFHKDELPDQLKEITKKAGRQAVYEDLLAQQLTDAGLHVHRIAGCFPATAANTEMNFMNLRQGHNDRGEAFAVALGGEPRAEAAFAQTFLGSLPSSHQRIHFLDRTLTPETLKYKGGIKCRTKNIT